jgi:4-hydroxybenzoyl-CoA thioesterase
VTYTRIVPVEFNHCDPAGIVFYPRYFEMVNSVIENFFAERLDMSFAEMVGAGHGVPTVRIEATFMAPSRLGDRLSFALTVARVGTSSATLRLLASAGGAAGAERLKVEITVVWVGKGGRAEAWPGALRARLAASQAWTGGKTA